MSIDTDRAQLDQNKSRQASEPRSRMSRRLWAVTVVAVIVIASVVTAVAMVPAEVAATGVAEADAAIYSAPGPHAVGSRVVTLDDGPPVSVTAWYPARRDRRSDARGASYRYGISIADAFGTTTIAAYEGQAAPDAVADDATGPYPVVLLSPGFAIRAATYAWIAEHLASHGFVVVAPEHDGEHLFTATGELWRSAVTRPRQLRAVLSHIESHARPGGEFDGLIDTDRVAVVGHSYGGYTALAAAGARLDTTGFATRCATARSTKQTGAWLCDALESHIADMAELAGLQSVPTGVWPDQSTPGVDAVVSLAGDAYLFDRAGLGELTAPVLAIGGTRDNDTPYEWGTGPTYQHAGSARRVRVALEDAGHMVFTNLCTAVRAVLTIVPNEFCADQSWDRSRAHTIVAHFTTAFLLAELQQEPTAAWQLDPAGVDILDVQYAANGYRGRERGAAARSAALRIGR